MPCINELIEDLKSILENEQFIKDFFKIFQVEKEEIREEISQKLGKSKENTLRKNIEKCLKAKGYRVSSQKKDINLGKKLFEKETYTDLKIDMESKRIFIELKLNYPPIKKKSSYKDWGYEEFISLKEKFDIVESNIILILLIIDAKVRRPLNETEKKLLTKAENIKVKVLRVFPKNEPNNIGICIEEI